MVLLGRVLMEKVSFQGMADDDPFKETKEWWRKAAGEPHFDEDAIQSRKALEEVEEEKPAKERRLQTIGISLSLYVFRFPFFPIAFFIGSFFQLR